ncbi:MAG: rhodanese-like domain-containing protein [Deltaproteobacteria bacterium]|jgi:rhodanese-related sulfurtransferase|nr:rhodanese-like domain-containing protein [Deltaproteobacteria bacterium]
MRKISLILITIFFFVYSAGWSQKAEISAEAGPASDSVVNGYRILSIQNHKNELTLTVYRGDYIKFKFDPSIQDPLLSIPDLAIHRKLPNSPAEAPYFKMKTPGTFDFSLGDVVGKITVINYRQASYREVSSREAAELIKNDQPFILYVRTPNEYKRGHLHDSVLIPVQELQSRQKELGAHKDREILIYCATGNRSTVASKILIDNGFKHIVNMHGGIYDWSKKNYPVTR